LTTNTRNMVFPGFTKLYHGIVPDFNNILNIENCFRSLMFQRLPSTSAKKTF
jgi:hypothetical protein